MNDFEPTGAGMGLGMEPPVSPMSAEAVEVFERNKVKRSRYVCSCGHPLGYHKTSSDGISSCTPFKANCSCVDVHPVLEASDLRKFQYATSESGIGMDHALSKGYVASKSAGTTMTWLATGGERGCCEKCKSEEKDIYPIAIDARTKRPVNPGFSGHVNRLMCWDCFRELWVDVV